MRCPVGVTNAMEDRGETMAQGSDAIDMPLWPVLNIRSPLIHRAGSITNPFRCVDDNSSQSIVLQAALLWRVLYTH